MKTIIFVRHGKSSWDYSVDDKDRPLKERGINDAFLVAQNLKSMGLQIDFAFSSPANRALHTALIFLRTLHYPFEQFRITDQLYDFSGETAHQFLKGLPEDLSTVLLFGHNYAFTNLVNTLGNVYLENLPTSGMAILKFDSDQWTRIQQGKTEELLFPKELR